MNTKHTPGIRLDNRTGQYFPTMDGIDCGPSSFSGERAFEIAKQVCNKAKQAIAKATGKS